MLKQLAANNKMLQKDFIVAASNAHARTAEQYGVELQNRVLDSGILDG